MRIGHVLMLGDGQQRIDDREWGLGAPALLGGCPRYPESEKSIQKRRLRPQTGGYV